MSGFVVLYWKRSAFELVIHESAIATHRSGAGVFEPVAVEVVELAHEVDHVNTAVVAVSLLRGAVGHHEGHVRAHPPTTVDAAATATTTAGAATLVRRWRRRVGPMEPRLLDEGDDIGVNLYRIVRILGRVEVDHARRFKAVGNQLRWRITPLARPLSIVAAARAGGRPQHQVVGVADYSKRPVKVWMGGRGVWVGRWGGGLAGIWRVVEWRAVCAASPHLTIVNGDKEGIEGEQVDAVDPSEHALKSGHL